MQKKFVKPLVCMRQSFRYSASILAVLFVCFALFGCAAQRYNIQSYTVKSGDTLYYVAWKYRLDPQALARWNNLPAPYTIRPGDKILIHPFEGAVSKNVSQNQLASRHYHIIKKGDTLSSIARKYDVQVRNLVAINRLSKPYTIYPGEKLRLKGSVAPKSKAASSTPQKTVQNRPSKHNEASNAQPNTRTFSGPAPKVWHWPLNGKVMKSFKGSKSTQQGIDIAGQEGQKVLATAAGEVVYSGEGPALYGQMVIIKHNGAYLSAYGYNSKLLVKEGDNVIAKQPIATIGRQASKQSQLHFEIRKYGKPVNPAHYLPNRS